MNKVEVITRDEKDMEKLVSYQLLSPAERMINMLKLMELSYYLRSAKAVSPDESNNANIIELKVANGIKR